jgi:hypothetical protein
MMMRCSMKEATVADVMQKIPVLKRGLGRMLEGQARGERDLLACIDSFRLNIKRVSIHIIHGQFMALTCSIIE